MLYSLPSSKLQLFSACFSFSLSSSEILHFNSAFSCSSAWTASANFMQPLCQACRKLLTHIHHTSKLNLSFHTVLYNWKQSNQNNHSIWKLPIYLIQVLLTYVWLEHTNIFYLICYPDTCTCSIILLWKLRGYESPAYTFYCKRLNK